MLNSEETNTFLQDGFVVLRERIGASFIEPALANLLDWNHKLEALPPEEQRRKWVRDQAPESYTLPFWKHLTDITHPLVESIFGHRRSAFVGPQLIGTRGQQNHSSVRTRWHLDTVETAKRDGIKDHFPQFHLVIGVYLTPMLEQGSGGILIWPGSHWTTASGLKGPEDFKEKLETLYERVDPSVGEPVEVLGNPGDLILMNAFTAHETSINRSNSFSGRAYLRYALQGSLSDERRLTAPFYGWKIEKHLNEQ